MSKTDESKDTRWVPAITFEATATVQQRQRNYAFYERIRDGVPGDDRQCGLKQFVFEVPLKDCSIGMREVSFRLDPEHDCYRRLVSYIVGHTDEKCDADDEVARLRKSLSEMRECHRSYGGGYKELAEIEIFHHGMETVCKIVDAILAKAPQ